MKTILLIALSVMTFPISASTADEWCNGLATLTAVQIDSRAAGGMKPELPYYSDPTELDDLKTAVNNAHDTEINDEIARVAAIGKTYVFCMDKYRGDL